MRRLRGVGIALVVAGLAGCRGGSAGGRSGGTSRGAPGATFTVQVGGDFAYRASPTADPVHLVTGGRVESGTLSGGAFTPDGKIDCGLTGTTRYAACATDYPWGTTGLALRATPDVAKGITYFGFADACSGEGYCTLSGNADKNVLVRFLAVRTGHENWSDGAVHAARYGEFASGAPGALPCTSCHGAALQGQGIAVACDRCHPSPLVGTGGTGGTGGGTGSGDPGIGSGGTGGFTGPGAPGGGGIEYHVGEGQPYASLGAVPWYALQAGDTVFVHHRPNVGPYHEKVLVSGRGTPSQWIRVLGVPGPNGELPVISGDGATTSSTMRWRWQAPDLVQWSGVLSIAPRTDDALNAAGVLPEYVEVAGLQIQRGYGTYSFTAEDGSPSVYDDFAACVYVRSARHVVVRDSVLTDCGQAFYDWSGDGSSGGETWWDGPTVDLTLRGNYLVGNGAVGNYSMHQVYTEALGTVIEGNRFGPMRAGALGSQLKDRSAGTVIRYNWIPHSPVGWMLDLVEPENSNPVFQPSPLYRQDFVYGNVFLVRADPGDAHDNLIHWNEDHGGTVSYHPGTGGRSTPAGGRLHLYANTFAIVADDADAFGGYHLVNETWGGFECPPDPQAGRIDARNNVFALQPRTAGAAVPALSFGYCGQERVDLLASWASPGWTTAGTAELTGTATLVSPQGNAPGFVNLAGDDLHLNAGSSAAGIGTALAPAVTANALGLDLTPTLQYAFPHTLPTPSLQPRAHAGAGADAGAFER